MRDQTVENDTHRKAMTKKEWPSIKSPKSSEANTQQPGTGNNDRREGTSISTNERLSRRRNKIPCVETPESAV